VTDIVLRGGTVVDGTGAPPRLADVAVEGGRIVEIGSGLTAADELDASGMIVSPGFVDVHTHYDAQVFWDPSLSPSSYHGVTTVVAGNCGFGIAPIRGDAVELMARTLQNVEDMSFDTLLAGVPWDEFETFPQYLDTVERRGVGLNYACYVGHTAVRLYAMGDAAYERAATPEERVRMQALVAEAIDAGAIGFASSSSPTHNGAGGRPVPSRLGDYEELLALSLPLRDARRGVIAIAPGGPDSQADMERLQRAVHRPITWTALLTLKGNPYHELFASQNDDLRADGVEIWPQISCRPLVFQINLAEPFALDPWPSFHRLLASSRAERMAAYRDPSWRSAASAELDQPQGQRPPFAWDPVVIAESTTHPELIGRSVVDLAAERGVRPLDVALDVSIDDSLEARFWCVVANNDEDGIAWLLPRDNVLIGVADAGAHVSQLCDACFTTDLLGNWVRDRGVMSLERAVHKLSGEPASVFGLDDRGTLEVGKAADVCVFDLDEVGPGPIRRVRDFPADGERLTADAPSGMTHVLVNGVPIRRDGATVERLPHEMPGRVLRGTT
jgi:N-acyl-D-aspartate/D-glutamate deacylase